jgi:hypothetical protein
MNRPFNSLVQKENMTHFPKNSALIGTKARLYEDKHCKPREINRKQFTNTFVETSPLTIAESGKTTIMTTVSMTNDLEQYRESLRSYLNRVANIDTPKGDSRIEPRSQQETAQLSTKPRDATVRFEQSQAFTQQRIVDHKARYQSLAIRQAGEPSLMESSQKNYKPLS